MTLFSESYSILMLIIIRPCRPNINNVSVIKLHNNNHCRTWLIGYIPSEDPKARGPYDGPTVGQHSHLGANHLVYYYVGMYRPLDPDIFVPMWQYVSTPVAKKICTNT